MTLARDTVRTTREVAETWFDALLGGDIDTAAALLADDVRWINHTPVPGYNTDMTWIGTYTTKQAALDSLQLFLGMCEVQTEEVLKLIVDGDEAIGIVHEVTTVRSTGVQFDIQFIQRLTIRDGRIVQWRSYTDSAAVVRALRGDAR